MMTVVKAFFRQEGYAAARAALHEPVMVINDKPAGLREALRELRQRLGLSYAQMGIRLGLDPSTVWKIEQTGRASMETVAHIARTFGLDVNAWLALAGYEPIGPTDAEELVEGLLDRASRHPEELTYEPDLEGVRIEASGGPEDILNLPPETRQQIERILRALLSRERRRRR